MAKVLVSIGSNLGDRYANIRSALAAMRIGGLQIIKISRIYETEPYGYTEQPRFLNCAVLADTTLRPSYLLSRLLEIERSLGRRRSMRWGPRTIDLDIVAYGQEVIRTSELQIPHPDALNRWFVLKPICEIAPNFKHPLLGVTFCELLERLS